jgi:hypothetical protein
MVVSRWVEFFGPSTWRTLHAVAFTYPENPSEEDKNNYRNFVVSLSKVLPCPYCSKHMMEFIGDGTSLKASLVSRDAFSLWMYDFHDHVNKSKNKESVPFAEVKKYYTEWDEDDMNALSLMTAEGRNALLGSPHIEKPSPLKNDYLVVFMFLLLFGLGLVLYYRFFKN